MNLQLRTGFLALLAMLLGLGLGTARVCRASAPHPLPVTLEQPDGSTFQARQVTSGGGVILETLDGYTIRHDLTTGSFRYAERGADGRLRPSIWPVNQVDPQRLGLPTHLRASETVLKERRQTRPWLPPIHRGARAADKVGGDGPLPDLTGTGQILFVLVDFEAAAHPEAIATREEFVDQFFSSGTYPTGSMRDYFEEVSYGQWSIGGDVIDWVTAPEPYAYYCDGVQGQGSYPRNSQGLVVDICQAIDPQVDFSQFDGDGDGEIDGLVLVFEGTADGSQNQFWPHAWALGGQALTLDGILINRYALTNEQENPGHRETIGVFCHEYGHVLGAPDLYDYDAGSIEQWDHDNYPVSGWCLMAAGNHAFGADGISGSGPAHPCAYVKSEFYGWLEPQVLTVSGTYSLDAIETSATAYELRLDGATDAEFFLVENRCAESGGLFDKRGLSNQVLDSGLLVMHIDHDLDYDHGYRYNNGTPDASHYRVWVEDAGQPNDLGVWP